MMARLARWMLMVALAVAGMGAAAHAQTALLDEVHTLSGVTEPVEHPFDITQAGAYELTLTDLKLPAALTSAKLAVTRAATVVGTAAVTAASASAVLSFDATPGTYVVRIVGNPSASGAGAVGVKIARASQTTAFHEFVAPITAPTPDVPDNRSILEETITPTVTGNYEVVLADLAFPQTLPDLLLSVTEVGGAQVAVLLAAGTATFAAQAGVAYKILAIAESPVSVNAGLFSVRIRQSGASTNVFARTVRVGRVQQLGTVSLNAGAHVLSLNDLQFPVALAEKGAALILDGASAALTTAGGDTAFTAAPGEHFIYVVAKAAAGTTGVYGLEVKVAVGPVLFSTVKAVSGTPGTTPAFSFVVDIATAGAYRVRLADFEFPAGFSAAQLGASQGSVLLGQLSAAGSLDLANVAAGPLFIVVLAQPTNPKGGLFGVDLTPAAGGAPVFETTQGVGNLFQARKISVTGTSAYRVTLTDLGFPVTFDELGAVVTRGAAAVGTVLNSSHFDFNATAGNYFINFIATPDATENAGTYGIRVAEKPPAPTVTFTASPTQVTAGSIAGLTWNATNATSCIASDGWSGTKAVSGTESTAALNAGATFKLECTGEGGSTSATVTVTTVAQNNQGGGGGSLGWLLVAGLSLGMVGRRRRPACVVR